MSDTVLPLDVFAEILIRLPAKDLFRCTCVCRECHSLITNPNFIKTHLLRHAHDSSDLELVRNCRVAERWIQSKYYNVERVQEIYSVYRDVGDTLTKYGDIDFSVERALNCHYRIVGSCNGVICLSDDQGDHSTYRGYTIILWNPVVKKRVRLPKLRVSYKLHGPFDYMVGFGFDSKTCDYKVLRILKLQRHYDNSVSFEVDIYNSGTGNWRNITHSALNLSFCMEDRNHQALFSGSVHWIVSHIDFSRQFVLSFDLCDEVFNRIGLPTSIDEQFDRRDEHWGPDLEHWVLKLAVIGGSLCVVECYRERYCVWMMKEYGVSSSWTKILNADLPRMVDRVVGFRDNGKLLIEIRKSLFTFTPDTLLLTELGIIRDDKVCLYRNSFHIVNYIETLGLV